MPAEGVGHDWCKFYAQVKPKRLKADWSRARIIEAVAAQGVPCMQGICPEVYLEKAFGGKGLRPDEKLPGAMELGEISLMVLVHPALGDREMGRTVSVVKQVMRQARL